MNDKGRYHALLACRSSKPISTRTLAAVIADDKGGPLFRTTGRFTGTPHRMRQQDGYRMIGRRARQAGIKTRIGNHSMRATGITDYLKATEHLRMLKRWPLTPPRAPPSSTTGATTKRHSMSTRKSGFES